MTEQVSKQSRVGKSLRDRKNGHIPYRKNTKGPGERGHLFGRNKQGFVKTLSKASRGKRAAPTKPEVKAGKR